jgi:hypothetical protein
MTDKLRIIMEIELVLSVSALGLLLISLTLPWLVINFLGQFSFTPLDVIRLMMNNREEQFTETPDLQDNFTATPFLATVVFYPLSMIIVATSLFIRDYRRPLALLGGVAAVIAAVFWFYGIESLKSEMIAAAGSSNEFGEFMGTALASVINTGMGVYVVIAGGVVAMMTYGVKSRPDRISNSDMI